MLRRYRERGALMMLDGAITRRAADRSLTAAEVGLLDAAATLITDAARGRRP